MEHILTGVDHMLFLLCLIIPLRGWRQILAIVTTFTVAHSFTLIGSAFQLAPGGAWFPPFVETTIAASIVYMKLAFRRGCDRYFISHPESCPSFSRWEGPAGQLSRNPALQRLPAA